MRKLLLLTTLLASPAFAADLPVKALAPIQPVAIPSWAGFYLGLHGGYGIGSSSIDQPFSESGTTFTTLVPDPKPKGGVYGGHVGYNWQNGTLVGGVEVDLDAATIRSESIAAVNSTTTFALGTKLDELTSARGRVGYLLTPDIYAYGTGGIAWGHASASVDLTTCASTSTCGTFSESTNAGLLGWVAGGGVEYKLMANLLVRAEYLHYDFARAAFSFPVPSVGPVFFSTSARGEVDVVRAGLSYKF